MRDTDPQAAAVAVVREVHALRQEIAALHQEGQAIQRAFRDAARRGDVPAMRDCAHLQAVSTNEITRRIARVTELRQQRVIPH